MADQKLSLKALALLDQGKVGAAVDVGIARALNDIEVRSGERKPRVVVLKITLTPPDDQEGSIDEVCARFAVEAKLPPDLTRSYGLALRHDANAQPEAHFSLYAPENPRQRTLDEV